jgi:hypothetical protein
MNQSSILQASSLTGSILAKLTETEQCYGLVHITYCSPHMPKLLGKRLTARMPELHSSSKSLCCKETAVYCLRPPASPPQLPHQLSVWKVVSRPALPVSDSNHGLTTFAEQSPSCETASRSASKEISVFYRSRRFITLFTRTLHGTLFCALESSLHPHILFKIHFNITLPSTTVVYSL